MLSAPESVPNCPTKQTFAFNLEAATAVFAPYIQKITKNYRNITKTL